MGIQREEGRGALAKTAGEGSPKLEQELPKDLENKTQEKQQTHRFWDEQEIGSCELVDSGQRFLPPST